MTSSDVIAMLTEPYPEAQARIERRLHEIMDAVMTKDTDRLESYHLFGPKFTKFDDIDPPGRQDATTTQRLERELVEAATALDFRFSDLKVDVFGPVAIATFMLDWAATMPDDQEYAGQSRATLVFVQDGGEWKITHEHFSLLPDAA